MLERACGFVDSDLEGRFEFIRAQETNLGNLMADLFLTEYEGIDIAMINSGAQRCNCVINRGEITLKTLY